VYTDGWNPSRLVHYLQWEHHQRHADEDDHQQLGGPDLRRDVAVAHGGEGDDAEIEGVKQGQVLPGSLQMLDPTGSVERWGVIEYGATSDVRAHTHVDFFMTF